MRTCRCPMCGGKNGSHKSKNRKLYHSFGLGRDECNKSEFGNKRSERRVLRRRMKQQFRKEF